MLLKFLLTIVLTLLLLGCSPKQPKEHNTTRKAQSTEQTEHKGSQQAVVAIGDLHGDLESTVELLKDIGLIDQSQQWIGGHTLLIQVGDILDRGDGELAILDLLEELNRQAREKGGGVVYLLGNHELMNVSIDFRYVTPNAFDDFVDFDPGAKALGLPIDTPKGVRGRIAAFVPGGPIAKRLSTAPITYITHDTLFVHAGITPSFAAQGREGLHQLNQEARLWMRAEAPAPSWLHDEDGPIWTRNYRDDKHCGELKLILDALELKRMVVGHETVPEIQSDCGGKLWRIDVGINDLYEGPNQALQILNDNLTVLGQ